MLYGFMNKLLSDKNNGVFVFKAFSFCHLFYLAAIIGGIVLTILLFRKKSQATKDKLVSIVSWAALCLYIADFFLMPFAYGEIDIDKLPFHLCTSMSIMCVLARHTKFFAKYKSSFVVMGFVGAIAYLAYPSGVSEADGYSYRIVQTVAYHGLMVAQGVLAIAFGEIKVSLKNWKYDLIAILGLAVWALLGNALYSGVLSQTCTCTEGCSAEINVYDHDFNWFFVKHDALYVVPDHIDVYFAPFAMVIAVLALCTMVRLVGIGLLKLFHIKKKAK